MIKHVVIPAQQLAFEGGTAYLLARAGASARRSWARMLSERGMTVHQAGILMALAELGPTGQRRLNDVIGVDSRNAVAVIDVLVARGLLVRDTDPADRRRRVLTLTTAGRELMGDLAQAGATLEREFLRHLDTAERRQLHRLLVTLLGSNADR